LCAADGWAYPESLTSEIVSKDGIVAVASPYNAWNLEWIDLETLEEVENMEQTWFVDAVTYLMKNKEWDLLIMHDHSLDSAYHAYATRLDPISSPNKEEIKDLEKTELALYQSIDNVVSKIVDAAPEDSIVVITSDHGAKATGPFFSLRKLLIDSGLTVLKKGAEAPLEMRSQEDFVQSRTKGVRRDLVEGAIDWSKTKAYSPYFPNIHVNLKGRDPDGIVEPGEEYEQIRDQVIKLLHEYVDPETGKKPVALALRKEDARIIGFYGDRIGDVMWAVNSEWQGQHGPQLPTATWGIGDLRGLFIMSGAGVKKGEVLDRTVWINDIVPTVCYLADLPVPKQCEGAVLYQALEDPDAKLRELQTLRRNYERLKRAFDGDTRRCYQDPWDEQ
jgi:predicted AlkP superfamily phosphohydrolase/phosphomutase